MGASARPTATTTCACGGNGLPRAASTCPNAASICSAPTPMRGVPKEGIR